VQGLRDFISRAEAEELAMVAALVYRLGEVAEKWAALGKPKKQVQYLRTARTFAEKSVHLGLAGLTRKQREKVLKVTENAHYCPVCLTLNSKTGVGT
jgi:hypothetical protein